MRFKETPDTTRDEICSQNKASTPKTHYVFETLTSDIALAYHFKSDELITLELVQAMLAGRAIIKHTGLTGNLHDNGFTDISVVRIIDSNGKLEIVRLFSKRPENGSKSIKQHPGNSEK